MDALPLADAFPEAVHTFKQWLGAAPREGRCVVFCHFDADGLAAGALFGRALPLLGFTDVVVVPSGRDESAFSDSARQRLGEMDPASLVVTDLGVNETGTLEASGVPVLYVDHHRPSGAPEAGFVVSAYDWEPIPCSAWLAYGLLEAAAPDVDELRELDWIAAVGIISDLGEKAPWPLMADAKRRHTAKWLKEATVLVNAARRASTFRAQEALDLLMTEDGPKPLAESPEAQPLHDARAEVKAAMDVAGQAAPTFSETEPFALVRVDSRCQVHPLIAQRWRTRLKKYAVICANTGYLDGTVAFSTRTSRKDLPLPQIYQAIDTPGWNGKWGHGHDQASGGHLPPEVFNDVLDALGFAPEAHVSPDA
ncbi:DHH family phosphoesterase [Rubricoccus marinus]|uniref:DDH domain-containing protein n=1 Tax=Rubricoccus marinus TaxID=716817 RepID=A0A259TVX9_9BACT|nr:DHH family phosphoesterase [Rubricoccus marinus]OZC01708.1 hypothetical protein BSZ36_01140 [Rubricoccus marinus]